MSKNDHPKIEERKTLVNATEQEIKKALEHSTNSVVNFLVSEGDKTDALLFASKNGGKMNIVVSGDPSILMTLLRNVGENIMLQLTEGTKQ